MHALHTFEVEKKEITFDMKNIFLDSPFSRYTRANESGTVSSCKYITFTKLSIIMMDFSLKRLEDVSNILLLKRFISEARLCSEVDKVANAASVGANNVKGPGPTKGKS